MTLLSIEGLEAGYGQLKAVRGVSLTIEKAETVALVGANGAGKTTLLRAIAGAHRIAAGRIVFKGDDISATTSHARAALGVALVPEGRRLFARLTVEENLLLARSAGRAREEEILFHREPGEQAAAFGNKPHAQRGARMRGFRADILALEGDPAGRHSVCAGDGAQKGGLAGAVRTNKRDRLALLDAEANAAYSLELAVAGFETFDGKKRHTTPPPR